MAPDARNKDARNKLLEAALQVIRTKGYASTRVEDICAAAGLSKGAFFHHFASKEELAIIAAEYFETMAESLFSAAPFQQETDPAKRFLGYIDFRLSDLDWKSSRPKLSAWYARFCEYPSMKATAPA